MSRGEEVYGVIERVCEVPSLVEVHTHLGGGLSIDEIESPWLGGTLHTRS